MTVFTMLPSQNSATHPSSCAAGAFRPRSPEPHDSHLLCSAWRLPQLQSRPRHSRWSAGMFTARPASAGGRASVRSGAAAAAGEAGARPQDGFVHGVHAAGTVRDGAEQRCGHGDPQHHAQHAPQIPLRPPPHPLTPPKLLPTGRRQCPGCHSAPGACHIAGASRQAAGPVHRACGRWERRRMHEGDPPPGVRAVGSP